MTTGRLGDIRPIDDIGVFDTVFFAEFQVSFNEQFAFCSRKQTYFRTVLQRAGRRALTKVDMYTLTFYSWPSICRSHRYEEDGRQV